MPKMANSMDITLDLLSYKKSVTWFLVGSVISLYLYRIILHPLRCYPGPVIARMTNLYGAFYAWKGCLHLKTIEAHNQYGSVVRQGPNKLIFNSATAMRGDIYQNQKVEKVRGYLVSQPKPNMWSVFNIVDAGFHRKRLRVVGPAMAKRSVQAFEPSMIEQVDIFIRKLLVEEDEQSSVNLTTRCRRLAFDVVADFALGGSLQLQTESTHQPMLQSIKVNSFLFNVFLQQPLLKTICSPMISLFSYSGAGQYFFDVLDTMLKRRLAEVGTTKHDLLYFIADKLEPIDVMSEAAILLLAGSETVSSALCSLFFYLSRNQECYTRLAHEIRSTFNNGDEIHSGAKLASCRFLRACIDEAMRMSPPLPTTLWRTSNPGTKTPLVIDGHIIPQGTQVGVNLYAFHHNESIFPDSFTFKPERWLSSSAARNGAGIEAFATFSTGSRACTGKELAYLEISLVIAKTVWYFDFERALGTIGEIGAGKRSNGMGRERETEYQLRDTFSSSHDGPYLVFSPRHSKREG